MSIAVPLNHFDRGKLFYPLVMNYLVLLIGFKDIAARGVINELGKRSSSGRSTDIITLVTSVIDSLRFQATSEKQLKNNLSEIRKGVEKVFGPLGLKSEFQGNYIQVNVEEIAYEIMQNSTYLITFLMRSAGSLLILAHEISKDQPWHDNGSLWEFLRHCKNAAAHNGLFNLRSGEPRRSAKWGSFCIEPSLNGTPLFKDQKATGLLSPGDPIRLLWDIEQAYPNMK
jgi:hypothetical protein